MATTRPNSAINQAIFAWLVFNAQCRYHFVIQMQRVLLSSRQIYCEPVQKGNLLRARLFCCFDSHYPTNNAIVYAAQFKCASNQNKNWEGEIFSVTAWSFHIHFSRWYYISKLTHLARRLCLILWGQRPRRRRRPPRRIQPNIILRPGQTNTVGQHFGQLLQKLMVVLLCGLLHHWSGRRGWRRRRGACRTF